MKRCLFVMLMADILVSSASVLNIQHQKPGLRIPHGVNDSNQDYPFVVTIIGDNPSKQIKEISHLELLRICSGSLLSSRWVLTAAHCLILVKGLRFVRCGDMTVPANETTCISNILKLIPHPSNHVRLHSTTSLNAFKYNICLNDIGLVYIEELLIKRYGVLHGGDYKTFIGRTVRYAGYDSTFDLSNMESKDIFNTAIEDQTKSLQIAEGVIFTDESEKSVSLAQRIVCRPSMNVAPKCANVKQTCMAGDSGGPLFIDNRIVGVFSSMFAFSFIGKTYPTSCIYIPVSPYLDWITTIMKEDI